MPSPSRCLTRADVARYVEESVFQPPETSHPDHARVGIELEWITVALADGAVLPDTLRAAVPDPLPGGSRLTFEPGGQLELSGPPFPGVVTACSAMAADVAATRDAVSTHGVRLIGVGLDPRGARRRVIDAPRYRAMERYFDTGWPAGRTMMRNTASVQVNLDLGDGDMSTRWHRAHAVGPVLAAAFANSPMVDGRPSGWRSTRLAVWAAIDPGRTAPATGAGRRLVDGGRA